MILCPPGVQTNVRPQGQGPALCLVVNQSPTDPGGWILDVAAVFDDSDLSRIFLSSITVLAPVAGKEARIVAIATIPGAYGFAVNVRGPSELTNPSGLEVACFCGHLTALPLTLVNP